MRQKRPTQSDREELRGGHRQSPWREDSGMYQKPSLLAQPGPSVSWGENVTLQCRSEIHLDTFHLSKEGSPAPPQHLRLQDTAAPFQANFTISPVWPGPSDTLELLVPGVSRKPSLLTQHSHVVASGQNLTLQCLSDVGYDRFTLSREGAHDLPQRLGWKPQVGLSLANFPLGTVRPSHRGRYRCYGGQNISSEWSAPSDPLDILVAGEEPVGQSGTQTLHRPCWESHRCHGARGTLSFCARRGQLILPCVLDQSTELSSTRLILHESCDLSPRGDLQVLQLTEHLPLPVVTPHLTLPRLHTGESHPDGRGWLPPGAPWGVPISGLAQPEKTPRCSQKVNTGDNKLTVQSSRALEMNLMCPGGSGRKSEAHAG
ncbi:hypothetical protein HPG69_013871 [Diceros bicornis minor]|uniref:Ig-like domain-containing protein n=1 Tax=Diceros bicornis minor TaxID=77932 RepID=A0A7J7EMG6_DICBM|nr:hypothetical protein HPG69_013871 [Diceros bicornis minor]